MKKLKYVAILLLLAVATAGCSSFDVNNGGCKLSLKGTEWKLIGSVNALGRLRVFEPVDCDWCFTLSFDVGIVPNCNEYCNEDSLNSFTGWSASNLLRACYKADYKTGKIEISHFGGTRAGEIGDGRLYSEILRLEVHSFSLRKDQLRLYYDRRNYLLFKKLNP